MPKIIYRHPQENELLAAIKTMKASNDHLQARSGRKARDVPIKEVPSAILHMYKTDFDGCWCAYAGKRTLGYGQALLRGKQWYLANLFIEPDAQGKGIGRGLLRRCLNYGKGKADSYSLCTFPFNETALGLYTSFGVMPLGTIFEMINSFEKRPKIFPTRLRADSGNSYRSILRINRLEKKIRGYARLVDLKFFAGEPEAREIFDFYDGSRWVGYAFVHQNTLIGPAGAIAPKYLPDIIGESFNRCLDNGSKRVVISVGSANKGVYNRLKSLGFIINFMPVFLSTKPYGDFSRYIPAHLAIF